MSLLRALLKPKLNPTICLRSELSRSKPRKLPSYFFLNLPSFQLRKDQEMDKHSEFQSEHSRIQGGLCPTRFSSPALHKTQPLSITSFFKPINTKTLFFPGHRLELLERKRRYSRDR